MSQGNAIQINLRVPLETAQELDVLANQQHVTRIDVARQILIEGIAERKRSHTLALYREGKLSKSKAAQRAGVSLWEVMDWLEQEELPHPLSLQEAIADVRRIVASVKTN